MKVYSILFVLLLTLNQCRSQNTMQTDNTIQIIMDDDSRGFPSVELQEEFGTYFSPQQGDTPLILKESKHPYTGKVTLLSPSKVVRAKLNYVRGMLSGEQLYYYDDGTIWSKELYKNGKMDGDQYAYYPNGNKHSKKSFRNDEIVGHTVYYFEETGTKKSEGFENDDIQKTGHWVEYDKEGNKRAEGTWGIGGRHADMNVKKGEWKIYDKAGRLIAIEEYGGIMDKPIRVKKVTQ